MNLNDPEIGEHFDVGLSSVSKAKEPDFWAFRGTVPL
jgi:hypothetical protein